MNVRWTKNLKKGDKEKFEEYLKHCRSAFEKLSEILEEDLQASIKDGQNKDHYFMPAWSEYQADRIGTQRTLQNIIDLIKL